MLIVRRLAILSVLTVVTGAVLGESTKIVDANEVMWEFFAKHPLPKS